ncbi:MAG: GNAT family N-acetyltransferase [Thermoplasmata archaeon]|nr:GNAT family N-acetyltransferase [Thermoplasmata archaeon]
MAIVDDVAFQYRHPRPDDIQRITDIMNVSRRETPYHRDKTLAEVNSEAFDDPDFSPEGAWLVFDGDEGIAYCDAVVEKERVEAGKNDGWIGVQVVPGRRGLGVEDELVSRAVTYLRTRSVEKAIARAEQAEGWKQQLFLRAGFKSVRHFYRMACRGTAPLPKSMLPEGTTVSHRMLKDHSDDEVAEFSEVVNDTFAGHFDFAPEPAWRWIKWRDACEEPWMVALAKTGGRNVAVCIVEDSRIFNEERGVSSGWVNILGVRKDLRGRGIGAAMLVDGMQWLRDLGHDTIHIAVDAENERALGIYRSLGFEVENESQTYHLLLR